MNLSGCSNVGTRGRFRSAPSLDPVEYRGLSEEYAAERRSLARLLEKWTEQTGA